MIAVERRNDHHNRRVLLDSLEPSSVDNREQVGPGTLVPVPSILALEAVLWVAELVGQYPPPNIFGISAFQQVGPGALVPVPSILVLEAEPWVAELVGQLPVGRFPQPNIV